MLNAGAYTGMPLDTANIRRRAQAAEQGVFGIVLKISAAQGIAVDVHAGSQPDTDAELFHFLAHHITDVLNQLQVPGTCQQPGKPYAAFPSPIKSKGIIF